MWRRKRRTRAVTLSDAATKLLEDLPRGDFRLLEQHGRLSEELHDQLLALDEMVIEGLLRPSLIADSYEYDDEDDPDDKPLAAFPAFIASDRGSNAGVHAYFAITATTVEWVTAHPVADRCVSRDHVTVTIHDFWFDNDDLDEVDDTYVDYTIVCKDSFSTTVRFTDPEDAATAFRQTFRVDSYRGLDIAGSRQREYPFDVTMNVRDAAPIDMIVKPDALPILHRHLRVMEPGPSSVDRT